MLTQEEQKLVKGFLNNYPKGQPANQWGKSKEFKISTKVNLSDIPRRILREHG